MQNIIDDRAYNVEEAAVLLSRTVMAIYKLKQKGRLVPCGGDGRLTFLGSEIKRFQNTPVIRAKKKPRHIPRLQSLCSVALSA